MGERDSRFPPHVALDAAVEHAAAHLRTAVELRWLATPQIAADPHAVLARCSGLWAAPGSVASLEGALAGIRLARESAIAFFGTCGGFQHAVLEFARNVLGLADAAHEAYQPCASRLLVTALACSVKGQAMPVQILPGSLAYAAYGRSEAVEEYYCSHGINPQYEGALQAQGLAITGRDASGAPRILEIRAHPFYLVTLFVPQTRSSMQAPHPLITAFLRAAAQR
jgi:CTP synthase (UTP-ammonia lyase)